MGSAARSCRRAGSAHEALCHRAQTQRAALVGASVADGAWPVRSRDDSDIASTDARDQGSVALQFFHAADVVPVFQSCPAVDRLRSGDDEAEAVAVKGRGVAVHDLAVPALGQAPEYVLRIVEAPVG